jgi:hypothetical protein
MMSMSEQSNDESQHVYPVYWEVDDDGSDVGWVCAEYSDCLPPKVSLRFDHAAKLQETMQDGRVEIEFLDGICWFEVGALA